MELSPSNISKWCGKTCLVFLYARPCLACTVMCICKYADNSDTTENVKAKSEIDFTSNISIIPADFRAS